MFWRKCSGKDFDGIPFEPVSPTESEDALQERTEQLVGDEYEIYKWMREFYSDRWIAETLMLDLPETKLKIRKVCRKLGIKRRKELLRVYGRLERPQKRPVNSDEIDNYVDDRAEKEIQHKLKNDIEGGKEDG